MGEGVCAIDVATVVVVDGVANVRTGAVVLCVDGGKRTELCSITMSSITTDCTSGRSRYGDVSNVKSAQQPIIIIISQ